MPSQASPSSSFPSRLQDMPRRSSRSSTGLTNLRTPAWRTANDVSFEASSCDALWRVDSEEELMTRWTMVYRHFVLGSLRPHCCNIYKALATWMQTVGLSMCWKTMYETFTLTRLLICLWMFSFVATVLAWKLNVAAVTVSLWFIYNFMISLCFYIWLHLNERNAHGSIKSAEINIDLGIEHDTWYFPYGRH